MWPVRSTADGLPAACSGDPAVWGDEATSPWRKVPLAGEVRAIAGGNSLNEGEHIVAAGDLEGGSDLVAIVRASEEHGPTALYGGIIRTLGMDREAIATSFRAILEDITSGGFAARFQEEAKNGYPMLNVAKAMVQEASPISIAEDRLRRLRGR